MSFRIEDEVDDLLEGANGAGLSNVRGTRVSSSSQNRSRVRPAEAQVSFEILETETEFFIVKVGV